MMRRCPEMLETVAHWKGERGLSVDTEGASALCVGAAPGRGWRPESLLLAALQSAVLLAFRDEACEAELDVDVYPGHAEARLLPLGSDTGFGWHLADVKLRPVLVLRRPEDLERAQACLARAVRAAPVVGLLHTAPALEPVVEQERRSAPAAGTR